MKIINKPNKLFFTQGNDKNIPYGGKYSIAYFYDENGKPFAEILAK